LSHFGFKGVRLSKKRCRKIKNKKLNKTVSLVNRSRGNAASFFCKEKLVSERKLWYNGKKRQDAALVARRRSASDIQTVQTAKAVLRI